MCSMCCTKRIKMIDLLEKEFPECSGFSTTECFGYGVDGIFLGDVAEGGTIDGVPACDYYNEDHMEVIYVMGVHKKLRNFLRDHGWFVECQNPGVYLAWEA